MEQLKVLRRRGGRVLAGFGELAMERLKGAMVLTCVHRRCTELLWPRSLSIWVLSRMHVSFLDVLCSAMKVKIEGWLS